MSTPGRPAARVGALILAAGRSARMGAANKLLAEIDGAPMVTHAIDAALASRGDPVVVVTGHDAQQVRRAAGARDVTWAHNPRAAEGLATSLASGLAALGAGVDGALVCLADMPWVGAAHLDALIAAFAADPARPICVPIHAERRGNPVLWPARHFAALGALAGDTGGRSLLPRYDGEIAAVAMADAAVTRDVDTPDDLARA